MKTTILPLTALSSALALSAAAGGPVVFDKEPIPQPAPSPYKWFAGSSAGCLDSYETPFYSAHVGVDLPHQFAGWDTALYLEVGYFEADWNLPFVTLGNVALGGPTDLEIIPVSLNYKLERALTGALNAYLGIGAGAAFVDVSMGAMSDDETSLFGQIFGGVLYNFSETVEGYAGARWIYPEETDIFFLDSLADNGDDVLFEGGIRINF